MASVHIKRSGGWFDRFRTYRILLDQIEVARIGRDDNVRIATSPGRHTLHATIDWCRTSTLTFELSDHEERRFEVGSNITFGRALVPWFVLVYRDDYLRIREILPIGHSPYRAGSSLTSKNEPSAPRA